MKAEIKQRWITALRSGQYKQGSGSLKQEKRDTTYFCCLGVLTDLCVRDGLVAWAGDKTDFSNVVRPIQGLLDERVRTWAGLHLEKDEVVCVLQTKSWKKSLANMNDTGMSFMEIADYIENNIDTD